MKELARLRETWETLGREDPLWAVASLDEMRNGRWKKSDFLQSGITEVDRIRAVLLRHGMPDQLGRMLDFGCGVGRLSFAWGRFVESVHGVDISAPMIQTANDWNPDPAKHRFQVNTRNDLSAFESGSFDLVFSFICLQHMPFEIASGYLVEFTRICRPGAIVAFQLPGRELRRNRLAVFRQAAVDALPFGLGRIWRRLRHGSGTVFNVYATPPDTIRSLLESHGMHLVAIEPDQSAGAEYESWLYVATKRQDA